MVSEEETTCAKNPEPAHARLEAFLYVQGRASNTGMQDVKAVPRQAPKHQPLCAL